MTDATANVISQRSEYSPKDEFNKKTIHDGCCLHESFL
ncbi:hypothetical protein YPC_1162 [Yersinia pestis biovar Medievalis str. Harbin 35]|nr:hypothetical protein YPC_1162 [Yersinia pestis biovar Medievalis str. Harbin 35]EEO81557.1 hypothetical protein YPF_1516 [Yersinia pestis biovar Orientalis str. India 195]EEO87458.1 hypothetical protein YPH_3411 [Yersinia pestis biovar Orientalis str. PEXU2]EEO90884.1 hypothetical protein YPS_1746 [Yersinia pestis Pestoides A]EIR23592.1 hypothetical protein YPPY09_1354 [Yersinia pestis PY-09]EIS46581.1 hypothetical protein YPPY60_1340 [Yersinia pestis PY-60]